MIILLTSLYCTYRMDDLSKFLRERNVSEETVEALEQQKVGYLTVKAPYFSRTA